jgi:hypothetical protein
VNLCPNNALEPTWPNDTLFTDRPDAEVATMRAELFHQPQIVELIEKALADRQNPG